jgi:8-oxo-dGTP pyrophosphatase MutT (NUDIX family)
VLFIKSRNPGYVKKDGTYVKPFDDKRVVASIAAKPAAKWSATGSVVAPQYGFPKSPAKPTGGHYSGGGQTSMFGGGAKPAAIPASAVPHPKLNEKGKVHLVHYPSKPSSPETWANPAAVATFVPAGVAPESLNGVAFAPWLDVPADDEWDFVDGQNDDLVEPALTDVKGKKPASGVIITEPDGRVWIIAPTNRFANTINTFPKGGKEDGLSLQANAIKECYEESGLKVEIDAFAGDVERSTTVARYYHAHRVGGTPVDCGWESQAVRLVPVADLHEFLNQATDREILAWIHPASAG